ncbi:MAG: alpha/beta fold hydrolase BchO [Burkholderiales bacterium]
MSATLNWDREGRDWPHHGASSFLRAGGLRWHVQRMGNGPVALLIHGTGASTHSWRGVMPLLARHFSVVAMDLPGHAFTDTPPAAQLSLPGIAAAVAALVDMLGLEVALVVGHSAGAAIGARLVLDGAVVPQALVSINGAFLPLAGWPGLIFPPVARLMAATPLAPQLFARRSWDRAAVEKLIGGTGSTLDARGLALYATLVRDARHAAGALGMMARWDLRPLTRDLSRLHTPLTLIVGTNDKAVPPQDAPRVRALLPATTPSTLTRIAGGGHLVHEERPIELARQILSALQFEQGIPA